MKKKADDRINLKLFTVSFKITQCDLFNNFILKPLKKCLDEKNIKIEEQKEMFQYDKGRGDAKLSRIINGEITPRVISKYLEIMLTPNISRDTYSHDLYSYTDYPFLKEVEKSWALFFENNSEQLPNIDPLLEELYGKIENMNGYFTINEVKISIIDYLKFINNNDKQIINEDRELILYQLSVWTIIAFVWHMWEECIKLKRGNTEYNKQLYELTRLLFPVISLSDENEIEDELKQANILLSDAIREIKENKYKSAGKMLCNLIAKYKESLVSSETMQDVLRLLDECRQRGFSDLPDWLSSYEEIKIFGTTNFVHENRIIPDFDNEFSENGGFYYLKCSNSDIYNMIEKTKPDNWEDLSTTELINKDKEDIVSSILNSNIIMKNDIRLIFAEDDFEKNISDALNTINILKYSKYYNPKADDEHCTNIEMIIRCEQEVATPIIDTACSILYDFDMNSSEMNCYNPIKIHILDEKKRTADLLYTNYPLFYPLTTLRVRKQIDDFRNSQETDKVKMMKYNLVIVSDNKDIDYTVWLIREAFELLQCRESSLAVKSKIMLLSPYAEEIANKVTTLCPGFAFCSKNINGDKIITTKRQEIAIEDIIFPEIEYCKIDMNSSELNRYVEKFTNSKDISYYIVDSSSDLNAIQVGTRIRKILIGKYIRTKTLSNYSPDSEIIAIRCTNPVYSNIAQQLIVPKETERDNLWFNDYRLITFGSLNEIFSWNQLTGGILELMSFCMHRQYSTPSGMKCDFSESPNNKTNWTYYNRMYNRDASYSAAMSLPYRLFEADIYLETWEWSFFEKDTLWSKKNRKLLADRFSKLEESVKKNLCIWEHNRFCCYLLSRGWLPAYPDEVTFYMKNGVKRHTLQIAQLHPCLCSWDSLKMDLYETLHSAYLGPSNDYEKHYKRDERFESYSSDDFEYFQNIDNDNINQTGDILKADFCNELQLDKKYEISR